MAKYIECQLTEVELQRVKDHVKNTIEKVYGKNTQMTDLFRVSELTIPNDRYISPLTGVLYRYDKNDGWVIIMGPDNFDKKSKKNKSV